MDLDKFYTRPEVAELCCSYIDFSKYDSVLEPSAGNGAFLPFLPNYTKAVDISPDVPEILEQDFLTYTGTEKLVIGNPPFGRVSSLAIKFFNHSATFAEAIAFIIPRTFRRISVQNKLDLNFHLVQDIELPVGSFFPATMQAKCCFQVWERKDYKRTKVELPMLHNDFKVMSYVTVAGSVQAPEGADFAIRAYGGNCGQISLDIEDLAPKSWHFIKSDKAEEIIENFEQLDYYPLASWTARQDSVGKGELIWLYTQKFGS